MPKAEQPSVPEPTQAAPDEDRDQEERVRLAAYYRALKRGFAPGGETDDWLAAEEDERQSRAGRPKEPPERP